MINTEKCIFYQLTRTSKTACQFFTEKVKHLNLTGGQAMVLESLLDEDQVPAGRLGERLSLTSATLTGLIDRIERNGFIERRPHTFDRRITLICLTDKGRRTGDSVKKIIVSSNASYLSKINPEERALLKRILNKLSQ